METPAIYRVRRKRVVTDIDIASLYHVSPDTLRRAVRRNRDRFPRDFIVYLTKDESQQLTTGPARAGSAVQMVFTIKGVLMLPAVLNSKTAIEIQIRLIDLMVRITRLLDEPVPSIEDLEKIAELINEHREVATLFGLCGQLKKQNSPRREFDTLRQRTPGKQIIVRRRSH